MKNLKIGLIFTAVNKLTAPVRKMREAVQGMTSAVKGATLADAASVGIGAKQQKTLGEAAKQVVAVRTETTAKTATQGEANEATATSLEQQESQNKKSAETTRSLARQKTTTKSASTAAGGLGRAARAAGQNLGQFSQQADNASRGVSNLAAQMQAARQNMDASLQRGMQTKFVGDELGRMGKALLAPFFGGAKAAGDYQASLVSIGKVAGLTGKQLKGVSLQIDSLTGNKTGQSGSELMGGLNTLVQRGMSIEKAMAALPSMAITATAAESGIDDMANTTFAIIENLKVAPEQLGQVYDELTAAGKAGAFELRDMAQYFPALAGQAKALGMEGVDGVRSLAAMLQIARMATGDSSTAAMNTQNFFSKLNSPETVRRFEEMGVSVKQVMEDAMAEGKNPVEEMIRTIHELTDGDQFKLGELFQDMQVRNFLIPMMANLEQFDSIQNDMANSSGAVRKDFELTSATFNHQAKMFGAGMSLLAKRIGTPMMRILTPTFRAFSWGLNIIGKLATKVPVLSVTVTVLASAVGVFLVVAGTLITTFGSVIAMQAAWTFTMAATKISLIGLTTKAVGLGTAIKVLATRQIPLLIAGIRTLNIASFANPIGLVIGGIILVGAAIYGLVVLIRKNWSAISGFFGNLWKGIKAASIAFFGWFVKAVKWAFSWSHFGMIMRFQRWVSEKWPKLGHQMSAPFRALGKVLDWIWDKLKLIMKPLQWVMGQRGKIDEDRAKAPRRGSRRSEGRRRALKTGLAAATIATTPLAATPPVARAAPVTDSPRNIFAAEPIKRTQPKIVHVGGDTIEIHIEGSNQDPDAIAKAVARELAAEQKRKSARVRSQLHDDD